MFHKLHIPIFILSLLLMSCTENKDKPGASTHSNSVLILNEAQEKNLGISTVPLSRQLIQPALKVNGFIDVPPQNLISISIPMGGFLKHTELLPGMEIARGQVLATLEDATYLQLQQDYLEARIRQEQLQSEADRLQQLEQSKAASTREYVRAHTEAASNEIRIKALEEKLRLLGIKASTLHAGNMSAEIRLLSPVHGFVSEVKVNKGKYAAAGETLFELVDPEDLHLNLKVLEGDLPQVFEGQRTEAWTNHAPGKKYHGNVILVSRTLGPDKSSEVHCHFDEQQKGLAPGMFMNAVLYGKADSLEALPGTCLINDAGHYFVIISNGDHSYRYISVEPMQSYGGYTALHGAESLRGLRIVEKGAWGLWMSFKNQSPGEE
jgi:cobalt-zinc-cadmium efflux system membrane fusion protein